MTKKVKQSQGWDSRIGVILAVAGSAVGLGNFLRFPGQAAEFGGGAFMIAYFISLLILGLPMGWMEWVLGRYGGMRGFSSPPGILTTIWKNPLAKYVGAIAAVTTVSLYCYYSYVEAWCLGYAMNFLKGNMDFQTIDEARAFWHNFIGMNENGGGIELGWDKLGIFLAIAFAINIMLVYRGISKGIEKYAKFAVPSLLIIAFIVLLRVLTLSAPDGASPEQNVTNGLGYMWNPTKIYIQENTNSGWTSPVEIIGKNTVQNYQTLAETNPDQYRIAEIGVLEQLTRPRLWFAAAAQVFFSLAVGFGAIMVYASYTKPDDDLVLSSLSAVSANEFAEVCLGGLISLPAAFVFLGAAGIAGQASSLFDLGFKVLPMVFTQMPMGQFFGFLFFFLLFIASISGVLCMLQSGIAFFEETLDIERKRAVVVVIALTSLGCTLVFWFSQDVKAMDTFDFWVGKFLIFTVSSINIILFGWAFGPKKIFEEAHRGAAVKIPKIFIPIIRYVCPVFLLTIFGFWIFFDVLGLGGGGIDYHILDLIGSDTHPISKVAWLVVGNILFVCLLTCLIVSRVKKYRDYHS